MEIVVLPLHGQFLYLESQFFFSFIDTFLTTILIAFTNVIGAMLLKGDRSLGETYVCVQKQLVILIK